MLTTENVKAIMESVQEKKTGDDKRLESLRLKHDKAKEQLLQSENEMNNIRTKFEVYFEEELKAEKELQLAEKKYKEVKQARKEAYALLEKMRTTVSDNNIKKSCAMRRCNAAIKEKNMKKLTKRFNEKEGQKMEQRNQLSNNHRGVNLELLRSKIPDEILKIIASYIPYDVRIQMIEHFYKPLNYLRTVPSISLNDLLYSVVKGNNHLLCDLSFETNAGKLLRTRKNSLIWTVNRKEESLTKIKYMMTRFKRSNPEYALRLLKIFAVLDETCKYSKYKYKKKIIFNLDLFQEDNFIHSS